MTAPKPRVPSCRSCAQIRRWQQVDDAERVEWQRVLHWRRLGDLWFLCEHR